MNPASKSDLSSNLNPVRWIVGIVIVVLMGSCAYNTYSSIVVEDAFEGIEESTANSAPIVEVALSECKSPSPRPQAICAAAWWYPVGDHDVYQPVGYAEFFEALERIPEYTYVLPGGLIPFQFGYAVNVISESYIVVPAKAGIHTVWLGRTW